jgi:hypothetical protein
VSIEAEDIDLEPYEMGNKKLMRFRLWFIDFFATSKAQRDDFAYKLINELENSIPVYDYDVGFPPSVAPPQLGCLLPERIRYRKVPIDPELTGKTYFRGEIYFRALYSIF